MLVQQCQTKTSKNMGLVLLSTSLSVAQFLLVHLCVEEEGSRTMQGSCFQAKTYPFISQRRLCSPVHWEGPEVGSLVWSWGIPSQEKLTCILIHSFLIVWLVFQWYCLMYSQHWMARACNYSHQENFHCTLLVATIQQRLPWITTSHINHRQMRSQKERHLQLVQ